MDQIISNLGKVELLIVTIVSLLLAAIAAYKQIKAAWKEAARKELRDATTPLIAKAETSPLELLNSLVNKPDVNPLSNEGRRTIVTQALKERKPGLLKKLKLKDAVDIGQFISGVYGTIKPMIKTFKPKDGK